MDPPGRKHRSAVIGAGLAGLAAVKSCLDEGIEPICFEQHDDIGGIWYYTPEKREGQGAAAFQNLVTNSPRETTCFSDFPVPEHMPQFMSHRDLHKYIKSYANHFELMPCVRLSTRVVRVAQADDYDETGQWDVTVQSCDGSKVEDFRFDSVFVCSGMLVDPVYPSLPGIESYRGELIHMVDYRHPKIFTDKRVLIIGNQHSAGDAANEAATSCLQAYISPGKGGLCLRTRFDEAGKSRDLHSLNRAWRFLKSQESLGRTAASVAMSYMDYGRLGIKPAGNPFTSGSVMMNDELRYKLMSGILKVVKPVERFTETGVILEGGERLDVDMILTATGYSSNYSFIDVPAIKDKDFRPTAKNAIQLYKGVFPLDLKQPTMVMTDAIACEGPDMPTLEMRSRWGARVVSGRCSLPDEATRRKYVEKENHFLVNVCGGKSKLMWYDQCDAISKEIGTYPSFLRLLLSSPSLALKVYTGPIVPQQYRLFGPGSRKVAWSQCHYAYDRLQRENDWNRVLMCSFLVPPVLLATAFFNNLFTTI